MSTIKSNLYLQFVPFISKLRLIPMLGAALLLAGIVVAGVQAAPPGQTPEDKPSAVRGEGLWIENCAPCHETGGRGDGPTAQMPQMADNPPTDFTDRAAARQRTLADMFAVTKEGRMDRLMPPWGGRLSDDQIWDVVAYAQTFSTSPDEIAAGETVYQAKCLACHVADGSAAVPDVPDLAEPALLSKSSQALFDVVSNGQPPSGIGGRGTMPAFAGQLSEEGRWRVVEKPACWRDLVQPLLDEAEEIVAIMVSSRKSVNRKL